MLKSSRSKTVSLAVLLSVAICAVVGWLYRHELSIAYERWAMNSAYNDLFGDREAIVNGLARYDVSGIDVDAVMARYTRHRQRLVELGYFCHLRESFPHLSVTSDQSSHDQRSDFVQRMWVEFPQHRHYFLSRDGTFEVWDVVGNENEWKAFLAAEMMRDVNRRH
jgi:hypothetical protein